MSKQSEYVRRCERKKLDIVRAFKLGKPCTSCGVIPPLEKAQLHHRDPSTKHPTLKRGWPQAWRCLSFADLSAELLKVDVLCWSCHRAVHTPG